MTGFVLRVFLLKILSMLMIDWLSFSSKTRTFLGLFLFVSCFLWTGIWPKGMCSVLTIGPCVVAFSYHFPSVPDRISWLRKAIEATHGIFLLMPLRTKKAHMVTWKYSRGYFDGVFLQKKIKAGLGGAPESAALEILVKTLVLTWALVAFRAQQRVRVWGLKWSR